MDVRLSSEQTALRDSAARVATDLGVHAVGQFDDTERVAKLDAAVADAGWRELRCASDDGLPWASGVEVAIVAEELGRGLADVAFLGPTLLAELRRLAGASEVLPADAAAIDAFDAALTRPLARVAGRTPAIRSLQGADAERFTALGLALTSADLVGVMQGAVDLAVAYAKDREQYGRPVGAFQAVQHLLADAFVALEGARSATLYAAWAVDALDPDDAVAAGAAAKAYAARAARDVCETAIQVHGGIGNTWECLAHVYLRRALVSTEWFGGVGVNLERVLAHGLR